jgi:hypothetical protein
MPKAMEVSNETQAEVSRVCPLFYAEEPDIMFVSAEDQFTLACITEERTRLY